MIATKQTTSLNGVNVDQLMQTVEAIKQTPELAKFQFRSTNRWIDGGNTRSTIQNFYGAGQEHTARKPFVMDSDEPPILLGNDTAANPVEFVLHALAGCLTTSLVYHAAAMGIKIDEVESTFEGDVDLRGFLGLSETVRNGYENIRVTLKIKADQPEEKLEELCRMAQERSPVFDIVTNPVAVSVQLAK